jgi:serine carboxypeptidase-like clade 1
MPFVSPCRSAAILALCLVVLLNSCSSAQLDDGCLGDSLKDHPDRMHSLPGWNQPLPSRWYSGYLDYDFQGQQVHTHYVLVEAEEAEETNEEEPKPLIYWSNGGPGASSLFGLLTELGPLLLSDRSLETEEYKTTGIPTPIYNPYTWTRLGSILLFDQPAPVGFSYCNNETSSHNCGDIAWTDELTSQNAYLALQAFYKRHPCIKSLPLYLTGESYGGIYIPTLARRILDDEDSSGIDLKGFAVGDGCLGTETSMCGGLSNDSHAAFRDFWQVFFMAGHHQIPIHDFQMVLKACHHSEQAGFLTSGSRDDDICKAALAKIHKEMGGFFGYALYDDCTYRNGLLLEDAGISGALNDYPCGGGSVMEDYLKMDAVQQALKVKSDFFEVDNAEGDFDYTPTEPDLQPFYKHINGKLKVLIYNGDTDPAITSFAAQNWTSHLGFPEKQHWTPWTVDGCQRMGGYVTRYEGGFDFLTIRGAGHMVPTYKPAATFTFLQAWIQGEEYPTFDPNCTQPAMRDVIVADEVEMDGETTSISTARLRG